MSEVFCTVARWPYGERDLGRAEGTPELQRFQRDQVERCKQTLGLVELPQRTFPYPLVIPLSRR